MTLHRQHPSRLDQKWWGSGPVSLCLLVACVTGFSALVSAPVTAQQQDCHAYAQDYANSYINPDRSDLAVVDNAMRGAVAGGAWQGPGGAQRGAIVGGSLSVLDNLGSYPGGWRGLYDMAYRQCRNATSSVTHRPKTLGDPSYRPYTSPLVRPAPPLPPRKLAPLEPNR
ncbi:MAG: hypothetical protein ABJJ37_04435 [Roseibium sp.]